ncbi:helix-turn-helix domain-containing protein [Streptomyces melanogenes]|uniref:AraC-like ligand-binding domain-containing protein n=1 Tax=Streptomyces melanogenes TaxID=67326 RepID=UPI00167D1C20|nr:helix-turn-helix domain-containing protein [Streptomyces melanogenes]GGP56654.1 AraC family transcriptional regulator [Streptomyces melanogenes]
MRSTVVDTTGFPVRERPEAWAAAMALAQVPQRVTPLEAGTFKARIEMMPLGAGQVSVLSSYASVTAQRTARHIRQSDPEMYRIHLVTAGEVSIEQYRQRSLLNRGQMAFGDSSQPIDIHAGDTPGRHLVYQCPKKLLRLPHEQLTRLYGRSLPWTQGIGRLFGQFLTGLANEYAQYTPADAARLEASALDLLSAVLAHHLDQDASPSSPAVSGASGQQALFLRMSAFTTEHLADPDLGPETIAAAHHLSLRYVHRVFQHHGLTPRAFIRRQRLDRCRRDLADPALQHLTIHAIAARWGYPQPDGFSRAFRTATGMSPSEYRATQRHSTLTPDEDGVPGRDPRHTAR